MTKLFERAVASVSQLPPELQDEIANLLLRLAGENDPVAFPMSGEEEAFFEESFSQAKRGEFADENTVRAFWRKTEL